MGVLPNYRTNGLEKLARLAGKSYTLNMSIQSNVIQLKKDDKRDLRRARGRFIDAQIKADGRTGRYVAIQIGLNPSSMSERLRGKSPFLADELEGIARVLKVDPVEFYGQYIAVTLDDGGNSPEAGVTPV